MLIGRRPLRHVAMLGRVAYDAGVAKARRARAGVQAPPAVAGPDVVAALRELKTLRDEGALSPEEFQAARDKVLSA